MSPSSSTPSTESLFRLGLNAALPISEEATTSRVVVNNEILRTVVFTFDAGQVLTEHSSPRAVIVTLLEGEMDFSIGERTERMGAGDVIYLAPGDAVDADQGSVADQSGCVGCVRHSDVLRVWVG